MTDSASERSPHDRQVDALIAEFELAAEQGRPLDREDFLKQHAEFATELREYLDDVGRFHAAVQPYRSEPEETEPVSGSTPRMLPPGKRKVHYFGDYEILEELGSGGMGVVYKARQQKLKRTVALKMIKRGQFASEEEVKRFQAEARAAAKLDHPGIVGLLEVGLHHGEHFYAMDFVAGGSLSALYREQPVAARHAADLVKKLAEAMHYAHGEGIVHRDLKPANVLLTTTGAPRITDFGLALRMRSDDDSTGVTMTQTGQVLGTAGYMSPEQAAGKSDFVSAPTDIYSLGAILYALLTSRAPFVGDSPSVTILQVLNNEPVPLRALNPSVPRDLETICLKCLEKEPHKRYGTAQLLADDLARFLDNKPVLARPVSMVERSWRWCRRNPWAATALSLVLLVAVVSPLVATQLYRLAADRELARSETSDNAAKLEKSLVAERKTLDESRWQVYRLRLMKMEQLWRNKDWGHLERLLAESTPVGDEKDLRGWEWHYLQSQLERRAWQIYENPDKFVSLDWDRKTDKLAVFRAGAVDIWFPRERRLLKSIEVPTAPYGHDLVRWSPDHRHLAVAGPALKVYVVDTETGQIVCTITHPDLPRQGNWVSYIDWDPRGDCVAVSIGGPGSIQLWKVAQEPVLINSFEAHEGGLPGRIHWSPDQATCVTVFHDGWAFYWKTTDWTRVQKKRLINSFFHDMAWSPDGTRVAFGKNTVVVANTDGAQTNQLANQGADIRRLRWLDNKHLITTNEAQELRIVHVDEQRPDELFRLHSQLTTALAIGPDEQIASAAPGESVKVWSPRDAAVEHFTLASARLPRQVVACAWHPRSNVLGLISQQHETTVAATWSPGASRVENVAMTNGASSVHWNQSGDALVVEATDDNWKAVSWPLPLRTAPIVTAQRFGPLYSFDKRFRLDAQIYSRQNAIVDTHEKQTPIDPKISTLNAYAWHPSEPWLAVADHALIRLCNPLRDRSAWMATPWSADIDVTLSLAWSRDGKFLLAGGRSGVLHVLDGATLEIMHTLRGHAGAIAVAAWSNDGARIVSAGLDGFLRWWDAAKGVELFKMPIAKGDPFHELRFSFDGQWLAGRSESGQVHVWTMDRQVTPHIVKLPPVVNAATSPNVKAEPTVETLTAQIAANPQDSGALKQRAKLHHRWHRWEKAADDYQQLVHLKPDSLWERQDLAITSLAAGRDDEYLEQCREIEKRVAKLEPDWLHTRAARILALRPGTVIDGEKLLAVAARVANQKPGWWFVHSQIPLLYRLKHYDEAWRLARRTPEDSLGAHQRAPIKGWEAMILWQLGRKDDAREALARAKQFIGESRNTKGHQAALGDEIIEAEIVLREAEALMTAEEK